MALTQLKDQVWIVTVNWKQPLLTEACVQSFIDDQIPESHIIIVDNGSADNSFERLKTSFPASQVIQSTENLGFAGGFNLGIAAARSIGAAYVFMVNNDTTIQPGMMDDFLKKSARVDADIASPAIYYADQPEKLWSAGGYFNTLLCAPIDAHRRDKPLPQEPVSREFLTGCALLIKDSVIDRIGLFDERFFLYYEDLDFIKRVSDAGLSLWLIPTAKLYHHVSASSENERSPKVYYWMAHSSWLYFRKHAKVWQWFFILPWRLGHAIKTTSTLLLQKQFEAVSAYISGFLHLNQDQYEQRLDG